MRMLYTRNHTRNNIFGFAVRYLNSYLNAVHFLQKLKKFILDDDETETNLTLSNQACSKGGGYKSLFVKQGNEALTNPFVCFYLQELHVKSRRNIC